MILKDNQTLYVEKQTDKVLALKDKQQNTKQQHRKIKREQDETNQYFLCRQKLSQLQSLSKMYMPFFANSLNECWILGASLHCKLLTSLYPIG